MTTVADIQKALLNHVPVYMKLDFDNVGHLVGHSDLEVNRVLVALDITLPVIEEARSLGVQLVLSHHPVIFHEMKQVTDGDLTGRKVLALIENRIAAICLHTNLDAVEGGVNDALLAALGIPAGKMIAPHGCHPDGRPFGICRVGELPRAVSLVQFLEDVRTGLSVNGLRYHDAGRLVRRVGCCGGAGASFLETAVQAGCDTFVTGDVKYDQFLDAKAFGINLIDADHFCTEQVVTPVLRNLVLADFPDLEVRISKTHGQTAQFF